VLDAVIFHIFQSKVDWLKFLRMEQTGKWIPLSSVCRNEMFCKFTQPKLYYRYTHRVRPVTRGGQSGNFPPPEIFKIVYIC